MKSTGMWRRDGKLVICGWHAWALKIRQAQIQQFKSDFRVVAEFFSQKRKQLDYTPSNQQLQHAKEVLQLFSIMTDDARFEDIYNEELEKGEGGVKTMCDVLDRAMEKGKGCTKCARNCPVGAITGNKKEPHSIDTSKCIKCGTCLENCVFGAISVN